MANIIKRVWNQNRMVQIEDLKGMTFQAEQAGHTFQISGIDDDGNTVALTGTPAGVLLRPDNTDVALTCSVSGGVVSATLPANCYDVPGRFGLTIFITSGSSKTAIYAAVGTVTRTSSGTVAPGTSQSVVDLINAINAAVNSIPASYSALLVDIAPTYSDSALYSVGQYAWYDGDLKRCIVPITTAESYTAAHWTSAVFGQDVSDLKSALYDIHGPACNSVENSDNLLVINPDYIGKEINGITLGWTEDGSKITVNGTTSANTNVFVQGETGYLNKFPAGTYTFTLSELSGIGSSSPLEVKYNYAPGSASTRIVYQNSSLRQATVTFEADANVYIIFANGKTYTNASFKLMIEKGSTATSYKSPASIADRKARGRITTLETQATQYGERITTLEGKETQNEADITGINNSLSLLNEQIAFVSANIFRMNEKYYTQFPIDTGKGVTIDMDSDGSLVFHGTSTDTIRLSLGESNGVEDPWIPAGTYTFKMVAVSGTISGESTSGLSIRAETVNTVMLNPSDPQLTYTFAEKAMCFMRIGSGYTFNKYRVRFSINSGSSAMVYEPHKTAYDYDARRDSGQIVTSLKAINCEYPLKICESQYICQGSAMHGNLFSWLKLSAGSGDVSVITVDTMTGEVTTKALEVGGSVLGHCNDMAYNDIEDAYYVVTSAGTVVKLDNEFDYVSTIELLDGNGDTVLATGIAYDRVHERYILDTSASSDDNNFYFFDDTWTFIETVAHTATEGRVRQGMDTDGYYIYRTVTNSGAAVPHILTYEMDGTFIGEYDPIQLNGDEIEGIAYDWSNQVFFVNMNLKTTTGTKVFIVTPNGLPYHATALTMWMLKKALN